VGGNELRYGSLFSGIGGIDLGMDMAGFKCAWQVEIDDYCREVLEAHWPNTKRYRDIYEVKGAEVEPVDIICGGFPCQPVSTAGKRGGVNDERWLWDEFYRLICEIRPRWVVAENVPGLLSANSGRAFAGILRDLAESGYDVVWDMFPAGGSGGVGAPHKRKRVFIVAHTDSSRQRSIRKGESVQKDRQRIKHGGSVAGDVADTYGKRRRSGDTERENAKDVRQSPRCKINGQWDVEPNVGRVANGVSNRVGRLRALGNAVVPQVAYKVARMIYEYTETEK
jgi:DNA (cytosine-5)-methyltransferase 1